MVSNIAASEDSDGCGLFNLWGISMSPLRKRGPCSLLSAAKHNKREIQAEIGYSKKIDPARIANNRCIAGAADAAGVVTLADAAARAAGVDVSSLKKDHCQALELLFGLPRNSGINEAAYFADCLRWTGSAFRGLVVLSADVHTDEDRPHLHILISPFKEGASMSKSAQSTKSKLGLSKSFFDAVAGPAGLRRAQAKLHGKAKAAGVRAVLHALEAMGAALLPTWKLTLKDIERNTLQYLRCLDIDPQSLLVDVKAGSYDLEEKAQGHMTLGAVVDNLGQIHQGLSCKTLTTAAQKKQCNAGATTKPDKRPPVFLERCHRATGAQVAATAPQDTTEQTPQAVADDLTRDAGTDSTPTGAGIQTTNIQRLPAALVITAAPASRRHIAHGAAADATHRHATRAPPPPVERGDGITREADADFDVGAWRDGSADCGDCEDWSAAPHIPASSARAVQITGGNPWPP